ncbi:putative phosphoglycerate mutase pmu1 [Clarireedia jacksonii]
MMSRPASKPRHLEYKTVVGYFKQDDQNVDAKLFDYAAENFGLIDREYDTDRDFDPERKLTQWQRFEHHIHTLNRQTPLNVQYKVLYLGRHGEGYHNIAETTYGTPAWNCYWSLKDGNGTATWADSHLAPTGISQALLAHDFWQTLLTTQKTSPPQSFYISPLTRCIQTATLTFTNLTLPSTSPMPFNPTIKELLREGISAHTCDRRSSKTYIHTLAPTFKFELGFPETDPYWRPLVSETPDSQDQRSKALLDDVFNNDNSTFISFSTHSGEINSLLRVLRHRSFSLSTGAMIPVLVKIESVEGESPWPKYEGPTYKPEENICEDVPPPLETPPVPSAPGTAPAPPAAPVPEVPNSEVPAPAPPPAAPVPEPAEIVPPVENISAPPPAPPVPTVEEVKDKANGAPFV